MSREPTEWIQLKEDEVEKMRYLGCVYYPECLLHASQQRPLWQGFVCIYCNTFKKEKGND